jgi:hypothetical protein
MLVAGLVTVVVGAPSVPDEGTFTADLDSEMRFFAVWYAAAGVQLARALPAIENEGFLVRWVAGAFFAAGLSRALSWATVGEPHTFQQILMGIELALPVVLVPWQAAVARRTGLG